MLGTKYDLACIAVIGMKNNYTWNFNFSFTTLNKNP